MATTAAVTVRGTPEVQQEVLKRYDDYIQYYWKSSEINKRSYKASRYSVIVLGALVTLVSSLSAAGFGKNTWLAFSFAVATPLLAATLAIIGGFSQSFQWGATWSDMVIAAERLQKERDRIAITPPNHIDGLKEFALMDDLVLTETQNFFQRLFGSAGPTKPESKTT